MTQADRDRLLRQWDELRTLWNEYDPIGVAGLAPPDEYDAYLAATWRCLEGGPGIEEIAAFLETLVNDRMGFVPDRARTERFARRLDAWFRGREKE